LTENVFKCSASPKNRLALRRMLYKPSTFLRVYLDFVAESYLNGQLKELLEKAMLS